MNPLTIHQQALDAVSKTVLLGDFEAYAALIDLPYLVHTDTARHLVASVDALRPTFEALHQTLLDKGITHYERVARAADFVDRNRIEGWHHTHLISNGERLNLPHVSRHAIVRRGQSWLFSEAHYAIRADRWPVTRQELESQFGLAILEGDAA
jgi:hypothetical protein